MSWVVVVIQGDNGEMRLRSIVEAEAEAFAAVEWLHAVGLLAFCYDPDAIAARIERSPDEDPVEWWTVEQTARHLGLREVTVRGLLARGRLRGERPGRDWQVDAASARAYRPRRQSS